MAAVDQLLNRLSRNTRIAEVLLDVLAQSGDVGGRARAHRALGHDAGNLRASMAWLPGEKLAGLLRAGEISRPMARRIGQALVRPDGVGLALCYSGLATPEKAYRRCHHLLAREGEGGRYEPRQIDAEQGRIHYQPPPQGDPGRLDPEMGSLVCAAREGMLEAIPLLFGLVPARVRERQCGYREASHCVFEVSWSRMPRVGFIGGAGLGTVLGGATVAAGYLGALPTWGAWLYGAAVLLLGATAGRAIDLSRQLEAVAGSRRGQLALLDQLDQSLAEKLDQVAKLGGDVARAVPRNIENSEGLVPVDRTASERTSAAVSEPVSAIALERCALGEIAHRVVGRLRPGLPSRLDIQVSVAEDLPEVLCEPSQIEFVVEQLLRNATEASQEGDRVAVTVGRAPGGLELVVEDEGRGIEPADVEEVFDPFLGDRVLGEEQGFGLPVCFRIVAEHDGQFQMKSVPGEGTRVSVVLPVMEG